jgi:hypothetical protein
MLGSCRTEKVLNMSGEKARRTLKAEAAQLKLESSVQATIKRGPVSWGYFYTLLGFALTIETGIASMFELPWNLPALIITAGLTIYLTLFNGRFQNMLIRWKAKVEEADR